ncbi:ribonuclease P protein subunit p21 [Anopheles coustani]|uniref:ribonuclease P protein subunit p21 n=1 Tax=Anopheles coustani TaxID=139045 RepID=UPI00265B6AE8|nr:ribonuclease P protein subunit p21 [Anopheles coustani]
MESKAEQKQSKIDKKKQSKFCAGRETFERMNYLYQAAMLMSDKNPHLSAYYGKLTKSIGKKAVLRMEPAIKRTLCVRCSVLLNPGYTADVTEYARKKLRYLQVDCQHCGYSRRFYNQKNHDLWLENPESVVETMRFE